MFDFTAVKTRQSVVMSIERMKCGYIDLIQIHDPEFADDIDVIINETLVELDKLSWINSGTKVRLCNRLEPLGSRDTLCTSSSRS
jgi:aryl-alcohol dehydrogenase-like predicted oxidoreductase